MPRIRQKISRFMKKRPKPLWFVITAHVLVLGIALVIYALPHHVIPAQEEAIGTTSSRTSTVQATTSDDDAETSEDAEATDDSETEEADESSEGDDASETEDTSETEDAEEADDSTQTEDDAAADSDSETSDDEDASETGEDADEDEAEEEEEEEEVDDVGEFRIKFADKFTDGEVEMTELTYVSENINVTFSTERYGDSNINIVDIYIADITCLTTAFGADEFGRGSSHAEHPTTIAARYNAIATLSGDYYGGRSDGVVIRNGTLYRDEKVSRDVCVLYWDGTVKCFSPDDFDAETEMENGAYQAWNFGPMLLDEDGQVMTEFNSDVNPKNPRSIFGYYEPGHYVFIMVEGRSSESSGLTLAQCSEMVYAMGLTQAYNLDGGQSATLVKGSEVYGNPYKGGRNISDVIMILDSVWE